MALLAIVFLLAHFSSVARAEDCAPIEPEAVETAMQAIAKSFSTEDAKSRPAILASEAVVAVDAYDPAADQFMPKVYLGSDGWVAFRSEIENFRDFRVESVFPRSGCNVAIAVGRFHVAPNDEYYPWFYAAIFRKQDDRLLLRTLRLPTPVPRKHHLADIGQSLPCGKEPTTTKVERLRAIFIDAIRSGNDERLAEVFSPTDAFAFINPTLSERVRGTDQIVVARAAVANFFRGSRVEDIPRERRAHQFCSNLSYGGILKVSWPDSDPIYIEYRNYALLRHGKEPATSQISMTLLDADIANNVPEDLPEMFKDAAAEIRAWITH